MKQAIRSGTVKDFRNLNAQRPLKIVLEDKHEKIKAFRKLRNLPLAEEKHKCISVSHDYSKETRALNKKETFRGKGERWGGFCKLCILCSWNGK